MLRYFLYKELAKHCKAEYCFIPLHYSVSTSFVQCAIFFKKVYSYSDKYWKYIIAFLFFLLSAFLLVWNEIVQQRNNSAYECIWLQVIMTMMVCPGIKKGVKNKWEKYGSQNKRKKFRKERLPISVLVTVDLKSIK